MVEFLVELEFSLPQGLTPSRESELLTAERERGEALGRAGHLRAIWRIPGRRANCGIWSVRDVTQLHELLASLPLFPYADIVVRPLARHVLAGSCPGLPAGLVVPQVE